MALSISPAARHQLTNLLTAFSLGTLCFIRRWYDLENLQPHGLDYFRASPADSTLLVSTILSSLILAAVFWIFWLWVERHPTPGFRMFGHCVFLLVLIFPIESVRRYWNTRTDKFDIGSNLALWLIEILLASGFVAVLRGNTRVLRAARRAAVLLTLLFPALMIDFGLNHLSAEQAGDFTSRAPLARLPARGVNAPRLIWLVFDELDQRVAFGRRPASLELPELDRLRAESLVANHSTQTAMFTAIALPSLLSGRVFTNAQAIDANTLDVVPDGSTKRIPWRGEPNVFTRARELGVNAELVGWHHPYCRIFGDQMTGCFALPSTHSSAALAQESNAARDGVLKTILDLYWTQLQNLADMLHSRGEPGSERVTDAEIQRDQQSQYFQIRDQAYSRAVDPKIGLLFVHFPTPHPFPIYNRRERNFNLRGPLDYFDNVALVDRTLGELRRALEQSGLWDRTALLITADHGLRPGAWIGHLGWTQELDRLTGRKDPLTVPFILKLPGQTAPAVIEKRFSNVLSGDLGLAVLRGAVTTPAQAAEWLSSHAMGEVKRDVPRDAARDTPAAITSMKPARIPAN
jgi:hypothetical protein